ncbi:MAG: hypothetical protein J5886_02755 [Bacteroidales bacterium]|nr:hypothetical protein [Bacteroidales bacterium]
MSLMSHMAMPLTVEAVEILGAVLLWGMLLAGIVAVIFTVADKIRRMREEKRNEHLKSIGRDLEKALTATLENKELMSMMKDIKEPQLHIHEVEQELEREMNLKMEAELKAEEERRQAEAKRRENLRDEFKYMSVGGFGFAYRCDYFPKNRYPTVDDEADSNRRAVWSFKDGNWSVGVRVLSDFLEGNYTPEQMSGLTLCVIPASSQYKNNLRYRTMCEQVCAKFPVNNGFSYIGISYDRDDSREQKSSDTIANLTFSDEVFGRYIILFDDVTTRGTSFLQVAGELRKRGALSVYGVFIGKTVW